MPWHTRLTAPLAFAAAALACSEQSEMQPTEPQAQIAGGPACKLSDLRGAARTFFGNRTPGYKAAEKFTQQNQGTAAALPLFFDLAHHIAVEARSPLSTAAIAAGAEVHRQAVACAPVADPDYMDNMENVKWALGPEGAYEVRGRRDSDNENDVVLSHNAGQHGSSGIKPPAAGYNEWTGGPVLFYGFAQGSSLEGEAPADSRFPATFQWSTVRPAGAEFDGELSGQVTICVNTDANINIAQLRIQHEDGPDAVVLPVSNFAICGPGSAAIRNSRLLPLERAFAWLHKRLAPTPLQAATTLATTSPSGSVKKFSPVEAVNPGGAVLRFDPVVIPDTPIDEGLGVKVVATGSNGIPWEGLKIKLTPFDNNGSFTIVPDTARTDENGVADFSGTIIDKPGGYLLLAVTQPDDDDNASGFTQDSVVSGNRFNRTPN